MRPALALSVHAALFAAFMLLAPLGADAAAPTKQAKPAEKAKVAPQVSPDWEFLGNHPLGGMYLDRNSIVRKGDIVTYWAQRRYFKPQTSLDKSFQYKEQQVWHELDCKKRTVTFIDMCFLNEKGQVVAASGPIKEGPSPIQPNGFVIKGYERVCLPGNASPAPKNKTPKAANPKKTTHH